MIIVCIVISSVFRCIQRKLVDLFREIQIDLFVFRYLYFDLFTIFCVNCPVKHVKIFNTCCQTCKTVLHANGRSVINVPVPDLFIDDKSE